MKKNICLFGRSGIGKTTLTRKLCDFLGYEPLVTSQILLEYATVDERFGDELSILVKNNDMIPPHFLEHALDLKLRNLDLESGFVVDNPMYKAQYDIYKSFVGLDYNFLLDASSDVAESRSQKDDEKKLKREKFFNIHTVPLIHHLGTDIITIDASQDQESVFEQVLQICCRNDILLG
ncbi:MAG: ATP-binding protein [Firmicutes bacterium]|nr:ATP-binding protein [Bacillota bacterium]